MSDVNEEQISNFFDSPEFRAMEEHSAAFFEACVDVDNEGAMTLFLCATVGVFFKLTLHNAPDALPALFDAVDASLAQARAVYEESTR